MTDSLLLPDAFNCDCAWCADAAATLPTEASELVVRAIQTHCQNSRVRSAARVRFIALHMARVRGVAAMPPPMAIDDNSEPQKGRPLGRPFFLSANLNDGGTNAA